MLSVFKAHFSFTVTELLSSFSGRLNWLKLRALLCSVESSVFVQPNMWRVFKIFTFLPVVKSGWSEARVVFKCIDNVWLIILCLLCIRVMRVLLITLTGIHMKILYTLHFWEINGSSQRQYNHFCVSAQTFFNVILNRLLIFF